MRNVEFLRRLMDLGLPILRTRDAAAASGMSIHAAGKHLESLRRTGMVGKIRRGMWVVLTPPPDSLTMAEAIAMPMESYISLQSALFFHGMIEQIPSRVYSVTVGRTKVVRTSFGIYSFHHCTPEFFTGYDYVKPYLKMATPEKALVDFLYFSPSKQRQFASLPELEIPREFSWRKAMEYCAIIPSQRTRTLVRVRLMGLRKRGLHGR